MGRFLTIEVSRMQSTMITVEVPESVQPSDLINSMFRPAIREALLKNPRSLHWEEDTQCEDIEVNDVFEEPEHLLYETINIVDSMQAICDQYKDSLNAYRAYRKKMVEDVCNMHKPELSVGDGGSNVDC